MSLKTDVDTAAAEKVFVRRPKIYIVIMLNDNITTMDFVVEVLVKIFHKSSVEASVIMMEVHNNGKGVVGTYTYDIAVTKKLQAEQMASSRGFPLKIMVDEAED